MEGRRGLPSCSGRIPLWVRAEPEQVRAWDPGGHVGAESGHWRLETLVQTKVPPSKRVVCVCGGGGSVFLRKQDEDKRLVITSQPAVHKRGGSLGSASRRRGRSTECRRRDPGATGPFPTTAPGKAWSTDKAAPASRSLYIVPFSKDLSVNPSVGTDVQKAPRADEPLHG